MEKDRLWSEKELRRRFNLLKERDRKENDFQSIMNTDIIESALLDEDEDYFQQIVEHYKLLDVEGGKKHRTGKPAYTK